MPALPDLPALPALLAIPPVAVITLILIALLIAPPALWILPGLRARRQLAADVILRRPPPRSFDVLERYSFWRIRRLLYWQKVLDLPKPGRQLVALVSIVRAGPCLAVVRPAAADGAGDRAWLRAWMYWDSLLKGGIGEDRARG